MALTAAVCADIAGSSFTGETEPERPTQDATAELGGAERNLSELQQQQVIARDLLARQRGEIDQQDQLLDAGRRELSALARRIQDLRLVADQELAEPPRQR